MLKQLLFFVVGFFCLDGKLEAMPGENCAFYGCSTGQKHGLSLFKIPSARADESEETSTLKKKARQALWTRQSTAELKQRIETNNIYVCELHFKPECLLTCKYLCCILGALVRFTQMAIHEY